MSRSVRQLFTIAAVLSVLLCVASTVLWIRSSTARDRVSINTPLGRHSIHLRDGWLTLAGPPNVMAGGGSAVTDLVSRLSNDHLRWIVYRRKRSGELIGVQYDWLPAIPAAEVDPSEPGKYYRALLKALDEPDKFAAAHVLLRHLQQGPFEGPSYELPEGRVVHTNDGLQVELLPGLGKAPEGAMPSGAIVQTVHDQPGSWWCDPAQIAAIRDCWHERLDVTVVRVHFALIAAASLVLPGLWWWSHPQRLRRRRLRRGLCPSCGYDLRATTGRCPECPGDARFEGSNAGWRLKP